MKKETLVDIVGFGHKLKILCVGSHRLLFSDELIFELAKVLKSNRPDSDEALQLLLSEKDFDKLDVVKSKEIERYLQLKRVASKELDQATELVFPIDKNLILNM